MIYYPNEYRQELHCYPSAVKLHRCVGSFNTLNDLSNKVRFPNKTDKLNTQLILILTFIIITGKNE